MALFLALQTQWRIQPMTGQRIGIDYGAIAPTAAASAITMSPQIFADLQAMENAAMAAMAHKS